MTFRSGVAQVDFDAFYQAHGPCCAGCDHWRWHNSSVGECAKAAPMPSTDRAAMLGITSHSLYIGAGHPFTQRDHLCGDFKDDFDWSLLRSP